MRLHARMRIDGEWTDATICNVSSRGLMIKSGFEPDRAVIAEVRYRNVTIIGQVRWAVGAQCGLRTQERLELDRILGQPVVNPRAPGQERRSEHRQLGKDTKQPDHALRAEQSKRFAHILEWSAVGLAGAMLATVMAQTASQALTAPLQEAREGLSKPITTDVWEEG